MAGSKVHYLFCIDFCKLIGQDSQRPNQESWEAMTLREQQAFVLQMITSFSEATIAEVNKSLAEEVAAPPVDLPPFNDPVVETPVLNTPIVSYEQMAQLGLNLPTEVAPLPAETGIQILEGGAVEPLPDNEIVVDNGEAKVVTEEPLPAEETSAAVEETPAAPAAEVTELPAEGDLGSVPPV